jgi:hypothetical protein
MGDGFWTNAGIRFDAEGQARNPITLEAQTPARGVLTGT